MHKIESCGRALTLLLLHCALVECAQTNSSNSPNAELRHCAANVQRLNLIEQQQLTKHSWREQLHSTLYDVSLPPNFPNETVVNISITPGDISDVDEFHQTVRNNVLIKLTWHDERLAYRHQNACTFPHRDRIMIAAPSGSANQNEIWAPKLGLYGRQVSPAVSFTKLHELSVYSDGQVFMLAQVDEPRLCNMQTARFPFDVQLCPFILVTYYNITIRQNTDANEQLVSTVLNNLKNNPRWYETSEWLMYANAAQVTHTLTKPFIQESTVHAGSYFVTYTIYLNRKSSQHVINWIVSPIVLSVSCVIGMYTGCDVGERFSFGGTIVVAITLMNNELREVLGIGADGFPILGQMYLGLEMTLVLATLLSTVPKSWRKKAEGNMRREREMATSQYFQRNVKCLNVASPNNSKAQVEKSLDKFSAYWSVRKYDFAVMLSLLTLQMAVVVYALVRWIF